MCVRCRDGIAMHRVREKERAGSTLHGFIVAPAELDALMNGWVRFGVVMWSYVCAMSFWCGPVNTHTHSVDSWPKTRQPYPKPLTKSFSFSHQTSAIARFRIYIYIWILTYGKRRTRSEKCFVLAWHAYQQAGAQTKTLQLLPKWYLRCRKFTTFKSQKLQKQRRRINMFADAAAARVIVILSFFF